MRLFAAPSGGPAGTSSREIDVQTARNNALQATAEAYFEADAAGSGRLAGIQDVVDKSMALGKAIDAERPGQRQANGLSTGREALLATFEDEAATSEWSSGQRPT